jgi:hypothetical protein
LVQKIVKYYKIHFLGDFGDIWIGISEDVQKIDFSSNRTGHAKKFFWTLCGGGGVWPFFGPNLQKM